MLYFVKHVHQILKLLIIEYSKDHYWNINQVELFSTHELCELNNVDFFIFVSIVTLKLSTYFISLQVICGANSIKFTITNSKFYIKSKYVSIIVNLTITK